jgi:uncharacterized Zn-binding protein involved in type VI secretion
MTQKISSVNIEAATLASFSGPTIANVSIANSTYTILDDTAVSNAGGYVVITGSNFQSGAQVLFGSTSACTVTFVDSTQLNVQVPALTSGSYVVYVQNGDGSTAIKLNGITSSPIPVWSTDSTLTQQDSGAVISISLAAPSDSNVTYSLAQGSSLPSGTTLAANGLFSGTVTIENETTYNFTVNAIDDENQDASRSFSITIATGDPYYYLTTLHLSGETPANNWLTDVSTNNFALTVNGDAKPTSFSPYETNWGVYFDGSDDYVYAAANAAFDLPGDFTIECWANFSNLGGNRLLIDTYIAGDNASYQLYWRTTGSSIVFYTPGDGVILQDPSSSTVVINKWYHIAVVRSGTTAKLYIDGQEKASATLTRDLTHGNDLALGIQKTSLTNDLTGYISNVRIVKGTAVYTSNFTPSTSPLTAISGTTFLACQSNRFVDNSTNNLPLIVSGTVNTTSYGPFTETDLVTGSAYFDGSGDYLTASANSSLAMGTGDFTVEFWINLNVSQSSDVITLSPGGWSIILFSGDLYFQTGRGGGSLNNYFTVGTYIPYKSWGHVAYVRSGGTGRFYANGVAVGTPVADSTNYSSTQTSVLIGGGASPAYGALAGYISNIRIVKGVALYTGNFTPPVNTLVLTGSSPYSNTTNVNTTFSSSNTSLLTLQNRFGENNNRFVDTSGTNNIITRVGNSTQGTFSPFSKTGWSNYFDGTGDYVTFSNSSQFAFGTGPFTIEFWINAPLNNDKFILGGRTAIGTMHITTGGFSSTAGVLRYVGSSTIVSSNVITDNTWHHCAIVRDGSNNITLYVDGVSVGTGTDTTNYTTTSGEWKIGSNDNFAGSNLLTGYLSNMRIIKGTALYTSTFTPSTTSLTAIANTSLLTCQSNQFADSSNNNLTLTVNGNPSVQPFSAFKPTSEWSLSTVGGSMYFDGSGDYLSCPNNANLNPNTNDFIMEAWVYITGTTGSNQGFNGKGTAGTDGYSFYITNSLVLSFIWNGTGGATITAGTLKLNNWHHVAVVRNSDVIRLYLDGVGAGSSTSCTTDITTTGIKYIGQARGANVMKGYMSGYRMIKGNLPAGYDATSSTITVPPAPPEVVKSSSLILGGTNGGIIDYTTKNNYETVGNVQLRNNIVKYGNSSMYFDGNGDFLLLGNTNLITFNGSSTFTVEGWFYQTAYDSTSGFMNNVVGDLTPNGTYGDALYWSIGMNSANKPAIRWYGGPTVCDATNALSLNTWNHVAWVVSNGAVKIFINGVQETLTGTTTITAAAGSVGYLVLGADRGKYYTGYIDDLRITNGYARYTSNFTPPTTAFKLK